MRKTVQASAFTRLRATALALSMTLGACGSSNEESRGEPDGETGGRTVRLGQVFFAYPPALPGGSSPVALFSRLAAEVPVDLAAEDGGDTCTVRRSGDEGDDSPPEELIGATSIGAGAALTFDGPEGPYHVMPRRDDGEGGTVYRADGFLPRPVPDTLTLDIPGGEFPAFVAVPFPAVEPLTGALADGRLVPSDTAFVWDAGAASDARIDLQLTGEENGLETTILCELVDDGAFSLSADTLAELGDGFTGFASLGRSRNVTVRDGDALLSLTVERGAEIVRSPDTPPAGTPAGGGTGVDSSILDASIPGSARAARLGIVSVSTAVFPSFDGEFEEAEVSATFLGFARERSVDVLIDSLVRPLDTCAIVDGERADASPLFRAERGTVVDAETLDAGETITFTGPDGTWMTLPRRGPAGDADYSSRLLGLPVPVPIPDTLVVDLSGGDYPGFADVPVPFADDAPLDNFSMAGRGFEDPPTFVWTPNRSGPTTFLNIFVEDRGAANGVVTLDCLVRDDGAFTLPTVEVDDESPGSIGFSGRIGVSLVAFTTRLQGDTLLIVSSSRLVD